MRLHTVALVIMLAGAVLVAPLATNAQQPAKVYRIGWLDAHGPGPSLELDAFRQRLRDLGYVEGENFVIEYRAAEGEEQRLPDLAAELVRLQVDVIVGGAAAARAAQQATRMIPIVTNSYDAVALGFAASLARPGGNITGLSWLGPELAGKRLEILKETVPQLARVAVLANPSLPGHRRLMDHLAGASRVLGLHLQILELHSPDELDAAFGAMTSTGAEALIVMAEPQLIDPLRGRIVDLAAKRRLPAMYSWKMYVDAGGLMSYGPSLRDLYRHAATYVDKILKGAKPADLPMEQPMKFELVLNLKTAQALGLTMPPSLLLLADEVIQ